MKARILPVLLLISVAAAAEAPTDIRDQWRQTIRYGIDSQVLEIVQKLKETQDSTFTPELASLLAKTINPDLGKAVLELFTDQKARDGEATARVIMAEWQDRRSDLVVSAMHYLAAIKADGLAEKLIPLIDVSDNSIALEAVNGLGKLQDKAATKSLLDKLLSPEYPGERKPQLILALGEIRDASSADALLAIVKDKSADAAQRRYAADALGKIGDAKAVPALKDMMAEKEAMTRAYAASALARFDISEVFAELLQGLRDDFWQVRVQSAKALARPLPAEKASDAVAMLSYKAEFDPEWQVRQEAIASLKVIGGEAAYTFLLNLYKNPKTPVDSREKALAALMEMKLTDPVVEAIRVTVDSAIKSKDIKTLGPQMKILSTAKAPGLRGVFEKLLDYPDAAIRVYAIKGIETNGFSDLKQKLLIMAEKDPTPVVQKEAKRVSEKL
jgi:HEAT repeat protein